MLSRNYGRAFVLLLLAGGASWAGKEFPAQPGEQVVPQQFIVKLLPGVPLTNVISALLPGATATRLREADTYLVTVPAGTSSAVTSQIAAHVLVSYLEPNRVRHTNLQPANDPNLSSQWALQAVQAAQAWGLIPDQYLTAASAGTGRIKVAILDSGIDCTHPDFVNSGGSSTNSALGGQLLFSASQAFVATTVASPACPWQDDLGHGTHVAGIVAAATSNLTGVAALGFPLQLIGFKILDKTGSGDDVTVANAIRAAADAGAQVISLSLGGPGYSQTLQNAVNYAWQRNALVVAAAGNGASNSLFFPADANYAVAVAATDSSGAVASFSNFGNSIAIAAPGVNILSTMPTYPNTLGLQNYGYLSGTSMATPHVSALAGLLAMTTPNASAAAIQQRIQQSASSSNLNGGWNQSVGYGIINAYGAVSGNLRPATIGSLVGQIVDSGGNPVSTAQIAVNSQAITVDVTGLYRFPNLPAGVYSVSVTASGFATQSLTVTIAGGADTVFPVIMGPAYGKFTGVLTDGAVPVAGAVVQAISGGLIAATAVTGSNGVYSLWVSGGGTYDLRASALEKGTSTALSQSVAAGGATTVNLTVGALGTISGVVQDTSLNRIANAQLFFTGPGFSGGATSDANGNYSSPGLIAGTYTITATAAGFQNSSINNVVVSADHSTVANVSMAPNVATALAVVAGAGQSTTVSTAFGAALQAKVTDGSANPMSGVTVTFTAPASGASATFNSSTSATAVTNASGIATSPIPVANSVVASYNITATVPGVAAVTFAMTNNSSGLSIWPASATPTVASQNDHSALELGVKFRADVAGTISGIRFYKGSANTGAHTGSLWTSTGTLLASGTFTNESATGWQQLTFTSPVSILANTTYVASYHTSTGGYSVDVGYFTNQGANNGTLHALQAGVDGPNGLYLYGSGGAFPSFSYSGSNYWVDVVFGAASGQPSLAALAGSGQNATVSTAFGSALQAKVTDASANPVSGVTVTFTAPASGASATFNASNSVTAVTNPSGVATTPVPVANGVAGSYNVTATAPGLTAVTFALTNNNNSGQGGSLSIWPSGTPGTASQNDTSSVELGVKIRSDVAGTITGIRFYKGSANTGVHTGTLWNSAGTLLATGTFSNETATGWQQMTFNSPVSIAANTTYVASYHTSTGGYSVDVGYFTNQGASNGTLHALQAGVDGPNGLYIYGSGGSFPAFSYSGSNYWVDVVFAGAPPGQQFLAAAAGSGQTATVSTVFGSALQAKVTDASSSPVSGVTVTFTAPASGASATFNASNTVTAMTNASGIAMTPVPVANGIAGSYNVTATAPGISAVTFGLTNSSGQSTLSIWAASATPAIASQNDGSAAELGVKFQSDIAGKITAIRFYKGPANTGAHTGSLWSSTGTLLATGTFTNETATGWQQLTFSSPVAILANTTYVASYHTSNGGYSLDGGYFSSQGANNGTLHALQAGVDGPNGLYIYGSGGAFPAFSYNSSNYWVDVVFGP